MLRWRFRENPFAPKLKIVDIPRPVVETPMTGHDTVPKLAFERATVRNFRSGEKADNEIRVGQAAVLRSAHSQFRGLTGWMVRKLAG